MADSSINVLITATTNELQTAMQQATAEVQRLPEAMTEAAKSASGLGSALEQVAKTAAGVFGGIEIANVAERIGDAFKEAVFGTAEWAESLEHLSLVTGSTTEELQKLQGVSQLVSPGAGIERLTFFVQQLNRQFAAMASGGGSKAFVAAMKDLQMKPADFADTFTGLEKLSESLNRIGITS
jgi:methyl-accepting chemotaxis protein